MESINLTPIIEALILLVAAIVTSKVIPWINARTTNEQQTYLRATIKTLVFAAEQLYGSGTGKEKLDYVEKSLKERGFSVDRAAIEAAVRENFGGNANANNDLLIESEDIVDLNIDHWSIELLQDFCLDNGIDTEGCVTHDDYVKAVRGGMKDTEPPVLGGAE